MRKFSFIDRSSGQFVLFFLSWLWFKRIQLLACCLWLFYRTFHYFRSERSNVGFRFCDICSTAQVKNDDVHHSSNLRTAVLLIVVVRFGSHSPRQVTAFVVLQQWPRGGTLLDRCRAIHELLTTENKLGLIQFFSRKSRCFNWKSVFAVSMTILFDHGCIHLSWLKASSKRRERQLSLSPNIYRSVRGKRRETKNESPIDSENTVNITYEFIHHTKEQDGRWSLWSSGSCEQ